MFGKIILNILGWLISLACLLVATFFIMLSGVPGSDGDDLLSDLGFIIGLGVLPLLAGILLNPVVLKRLPIAKTYFHKILRIVLVLVVLGVADWGASTLYDNDQAQKAAIKEAADDAAQHIIDERNLGADLLNGDHGTKEDPDAALPHLLFAAKKGDTAAMIYASTYYTDDAKPENKAEAKAWRDKAAAALNNSQDGDLLYKLSGTYDYDDPLREATELRAANLNSCPAMADMTIIHQDQKPMWRDRIVKAADGTADYLCLLDAGIMYEGSTPSSPERETSVYWWKRSVDEGSLWAYVMLQEAYTDGKNGAEKDDYKGCDWARKGAFAGESTSMYWTGLCYIDGTNGWPKNPGKARYWLHQYGALSTDFTKDNAGYPWLVAHPGPDTTDAEGTPP